MYGTRTKKRFTRQGNGTRKAYSKKSTSIQRYSRVPTRTITPYRSKWKNPLPQKGSFKFRYNDINFVFTLAAPLWASENVWRGNSLHDPDLTGVGVQPYGFDQYCSTNAPFRSYCVYASKIKVYPHVSTEDSTKVRGIRIIVAPSRDINTFTYNNFDDMKQVVGSRALVINSIDDQRGHLSAYMSTGRLWGDLGGKVDTDFMAYYGNNPANQWYWIVKVENTGTQLEVEVQMDVEITYYTMMAKGDDVNES